LFLKEFVTKNKPIISFYIHHNFFFLQQAQFAATGAAKAAGTFSSRVNLYSVVVQCRCRRSDPTNRQCSSSAFKRPSPTTAASTAAAGGFRPAGVRRLELLGWLGATAAAARSRHTTATAARLRSLHRYAVAWTCYNKA
jgi:hypothetical protein